MLRVMLFRAAFNAPRQIRPNSSNVRKGLRLGGRTHASRYTLTWLPTAEGEPATNRWLKLTKADVLQLREEKRQRKLIADDRKTARTKVATFIEKKRSVGTEILKGGLEVEPGFVRKVEPVEGGTSTGSSAGRVRELGARAKL